MSMGCEIVALIGFIEETKVRFLRGTPRAKDLRRELDCGLRPFSLRCRDSTAGTTGSCIPVSRRVRVGNDGRRGGNVQGMEDISTI